MTRWWQSKGVMLGLALVVAWCTLLPAFGDARGMVTRIQGEDVVVNLGLQKGMQPGTKLYVYDALGHPVATVQVTQVDESSAHVQIMSMEPGSALTLGNQVSDAPYTPAALPPRPSPSPASAVAVAGTPQPVTPGGRVSDGNKTGDAFKTFAEVLKHHTQMYSFRGGKGGGVKINVVDVLNIVSTLGLTPAGAQGFIVNPWLITSTAYDTYSSYEASAKANQRARSYMQMIYWDPSLINAYADYYMYKENISDPARRDEMRRSLLAQKGVNSSAVFQLKIRNAGPGAMQLAPFDWHCYMLDPQGNRVKAERYDEILDKALNPGQEVDGYIFFPRRDPVGKTYVADPPTILIEDVFGERATIKFTAVGKN